jgi:hypothetical protein
VIKEVASALRRGEKKRGPAKRSAARIAGAGWKCLPVSGNVKAIASSHVEPKKPKLVLGYSKKENLSSALAVFENLVDPDESIPPASEFGEKLLERAAKLVRAVGRSADVNEKDEAVETVRVAKRGPLFLCASAYCYASRRKIASRRL